MKEGIAFLIKNTRPEDLRMGGDNEGMRMRICPACYTVVPACTSRCTSCWSQFISCGKYQRNIARETPSEIPSSSIAQTMEAATAAVPTVEVDDDEQVDTATVAEPEMEIDEQQSVGEPEQDKEMLQEFLEYEEDVTQETLQERRPLLLPDPDLLQAQTPMQTPYYPEKTGGRCVDAIRTAFAYMAYCLVRPMYKVRPTTASWVTMPFFRMQEKFSQGSRYDVLGSWPGTLSEVDPETHVSREVTDEEILAFARAKADAEDPEGTYLLRRFRANQILSALVRGSIQMGLLEGYVQA